MHALWVGVIALFSPLSIRKTLVCPESQEPMAVKLQMCDFEFIIYLYIYTYIFFL